ncbi:MAG TPA: type II and III secretion system protein family protein [Tepidisphaeraceae bacterium]|nr:type II and III secretion system protein family protein [Tepidisphaeraceae bacterium]
MKTSKPDEKQIVSESCAARPSAHGRTLRRALCAAAFGILTVMACSASAEDAAPVPDNAATATQHLVADGVNDRGGLELNPGQSSVITLRMPCNKLDVEVGNPDVVHCRAISPTQILVTAEKAGMTQVVVSCDEGGSQTVDVMVTPNLKELREQIKKMFPASNVDVSSASGSIVLRGRAPDLEAANRIAQVAGPYGAHVLNFLEISGGQQIMVKVRFAEVSRSLTQNLGFNAFATDGRMKAGLNNGPSDNPIGGLIAPAAASGSATTTIPPVALFGSGQVGNTAFEYFIDALRQNNLLRVLAQPNLTVISGKKASFIAGGEFPVPVPQASGSGGVAITVDFKQFGVMLNFTPTVLGNGRIRMDVSPEVSDLDFTNSVSFNGFVIPSITKRTVNTTVELEEGQTLALAGLLENKVTANKSITPLLGDLPILGALFRSVKYERSETELVVLVTPVLVEPMNPGQVPTIPGEHWRYPNEAQLFLGADLGGPAPDTDHAPSMRPPPQFHGDYGFTPAAQTGPSH